MAGTLKRPMSGLKCGVNTMVPSEPQLAPRLSIGMLHMVKGAPPVIDTFFNLSPAKKTYPLTIRREKGAAGTLGSGQKCRCKAVQLTHVKLGCAASARNIN